MSEPNKYIETSHVPFISTEQKHRSGTALAAQMREIMGEEQDWAMTFNAELKTPRQFCSCVSAVNRSQR
jgi:hypothetical protein